jgi:hypothetical protein
MCLQAAYSVSEKGVQSKRREELKSAKRKR